jgi:hypothetical protein
VSRQSPVDLLPSTIEAQVSSLNNSIKYNPVQECRYQEASCMRVQVAVAEIGQRSYVRNRRHGNSTYSEAS